MLIADLEALHKKATPGKWEYRLDAGDVSVEPGVCNCGGADVGAVEDGQLIAAMHNALPAFLTALRAAEDVYPFVADKGCIAIELPDRRFINREQAVEAFRLALAALGEGPREGKS